MSTLSERVRARDETARRNQFSREILSERRSKILAETAESLLAGKDPDKEVLPALYKALAAERIVDGTLGFIVTDQHSTTMKLGFIKGFPEEMVQRCLTLDFGQAICGTVAKTRQPIHATNIQKNLDPLADLVRSAGMTAYACQPLGSRRQILRNLVVRVAQPQRVRDRGSAVFPRYRPPCRGRSVKVSRTARLTPTRHSSGINAGARRVRPSHGAAKALPRR